jgi:uroporphyrinogen-III synthase
VTFSSRRGVRGVDRLGLAAQLMPAEIIVAAVGPSTAEELENCGLRVDLVADPPTGEVLAGALLQRLPAGSRIVSVRGNLRTGNLDERLHQGGHRVESLEVYQNVDPGVPAMDPFPLSAVVVASPSAGRRLVEKNPWIKQHRFCAIGPTTAAALEDLGITRVRQLGPDRAGWVDELLTEET